MFVSRLAEELLPFPFYVVRAKRQRRRCEAPELLDQPAFKDYARLSAEQLGERLKEERVRAAALDDKTFKLTLSLSIGLTVLGSTTVFLIRAVISPSMQASLTIVIGAALFLRAVGRVRCARRPAHAAVIRLRHPFPVAARG